MNRAELVENIRSKKSYLCIGLDSDIEKIPAHLLQFSDPVFEFNKQLIDATKNHCVAYKINTAFYEARGSIGWQTMEKTIDYIGSSHFTIADAKRSDIGNTAEQYARAFFEKMHFDAITVAPYMGRDSIEPFLHYKDKWTIVLGLTSNAGAQDFELKNLDDGPLYEKVLTTVSQWGNINNLMFVIGATQADAFEKIRQLTPDHFYLVPGVGAQGGSLSEISKKAMTKECGILVNVSRAIIYASEGKDFAVKAAEIALKYSNEMAAYLKMLV